MFYDLVNENNENENKFIGNDLYDESYYGNFGAYESINYSGNHLDYDENSYKSVGNLFEGFDFNEKDEKENQIPFIRLNKLEEKKNDINDNGVKSHCNLTYSMINHEESEEKESNKPFKKKNKFCIRFPHPRKRWRKRRKNL